MKTMRLTATLIFCGIAMARTVSLLQYATAHAKPLRNPFAEDVSAVRAGAKLYQRECADCHGENGQGAGHAPPLAYLSVRQAPPGALFWVLRNGSAARRMPSFAHLPAAQRWQIITFLQRGMSNQKPGQ